MTDITLRLPGRAITCSVDLPLSRTWNQIAKTGSFKGHSMGAFEITTATYDQIIANFNASENRKIPVDYEHLSETLDTRDAALTGTPACAWIVDLSIKGDELWALFEWVSPKAVEQVRSKQYMFLSPSIVLNSTDPVSGEKRGARLTSTALTNHPFLDGMVPVTASAEQKPAIEVLPIKKEKSQMELLAKLRKLLSLKEDTTDETVYVSVEQVVTAHQALLRAEAERVVLSRKQIPEAGRVAATTLCLSDRKTFDVLFPEIKEVEKKVELTTEVKTEQPLTPTGNGPTGVDKVALTNQVVKPNSPPGQWSGTEVNEEEEIEKEVARIMSEEKDILIDVAYMRASKNLRDKQVLSAVSAIAQRGNR